MRYLRFVLAKMPSERKTQVLEVISTRDESVLGEIRWYGAWRQYAFFPTAYTIFNPDCMEAISEKCREMTKDHRRAKQATGAMP